MSCASAPEQLAGLLRTQSSMSKTFIYWRPPNWGCYSRSSHKSDKYRRSGRLSGSAACRSCEYNNQVFTATRSHCWFNFSSKIARSFSEKLFPGQPTLSLHFCIGSFHPRCKALYLLLLNIVKFLSAHFSRLSKSL